ncbi:MAG TPA: HD domain-containing protein [Thermoclostridium caenicola]|uniref:HD domain-containing protein n=1 Tax=Thermoclostridium caenicola TaxID=659425 RepID=UPI002CFAB5D2|nr:HD domain-containing protein [Thermoclostridium caenicola]HOK42431.1 HD domain-containing protein [Thermoclostridium caenicola]HOL85549.1 HD domain-containing protein [Thermoclostridium caenicola]HPO76951.1 HD domain-containing protein [Thermoclostridium caenicola]
MTPREILNFLGVAEKLKSVLRHSWTSTGRQESVAEHSWRLCVFAWLLKNRFPDINMNKVIRMCLFHDLGEALTGDIPSFEKTGSDENTEKLAISRILDMLDDDLKAELAALFREMEEQKTREARLYKTLDKLEAVIQHNEAPLETWIPLEYELNLTYADDYVKGDPFLEEFREQMRKDILEKIAGGK